MTHIYAGRKPRGWPMPAGVLEGMVDPQTGLLLASGCAPWSGVAYKELFVQGAVPVTVCPSQGPIMTAEMLPLPARPDYEEGMETGVPLEEVPKPRTPGGEAVRLGDGTTTTEAPAARPAAPPTEEPASEPAREASPDSAPSPTPSPGLPL